MNFYEMYMDSISIRKNTSNEDNPGILISNLYSYKNLPISHAQQSSFLHLLASGNLFCENLFSFSFRSMNCCMLLYTTIGSGTLSFQNTSVSLTEKHLLIFDCNQRFSLQGALLPWSFKIFFFSGDRLELYKELLQLKNGPCFQLPEFSPLHHSINQLIRIDSSVSMSQFLLMQQLLEQICTTLYVTEHPLSQERRFSIPVYLIEMKDIFDHHYADEFSLPVYQERYKISKFRLCREFATYFGEPPLHYLNHRRIEAAKEMLLTTDLNVHMISSLVGIENVNHFINLFKKYVGTTPNAFRQKAPAAQPVLRSPAQ